MINTAKEIAKLEHKCDDAITEVYKNITALGWITRNGEGNTLQLIKDFHKRLRDIELIANCWITILEDTNND